jgi:manganese-dependent ADP-ribose/CDP-alcohol diphosphatase
VPFNGALSQQQLTWLRDELDDAKQQGQRVLVFGHCPLHPGSVGERLRTLTWNYQDVLKELWQAGNVVATFSGHIHQWNCHRDEHGVTHFTIPALLEADIAHDACHGIVHVLDNGIKLEGIGSMPSADVHFAHSSNSVCDV